MFLVFLPLTHRHNSSNMTTIVRLTIFRHNIYPSSLQIVCIEHTFYLCFEYKVCKYNETHHDHLPIVMQQHHIKWTTLSGQIRFKTVDVNYLWDAHHQCGLLWHFLPKTLPSVVGTVGCFTNVLRVLQNVLSKMVYCRNRTFYELFNLILCTLHWNTYKVSTWNSHKKCHFWHCMFSRDYFGELTECWWKNTGSRPSATCSVGEIHTTLWVQLDMWHAYQKNTNI